MNYFEFLDIPFSLSVDKSQLRKHYFVNSRKYHPDHHSQASAETVERMMEMSTLNTKAYEVLGDFDQRLAYVLELLDGGEIKKYDLSPAFLMEMMEINESIMDMPEEQKEEKKQEILSRDIESYEALGYIVEMDLSTVLEDELRRLKAYYFERKYLLRIIENLDNLASL
jgi:molecular chaperone HscB